MRTDNRTFDSRSQVVGRLSGWGCAGKSGNRRINSRCRYRSTRATAGEGVTLFSPAAAVGKAILLAALS
jgi:hypothetical protein